MAEPFADPPIIKWMARPADALDHLRKLNSFELGTSLAALWRVASLEGASTSIMFGRPCRRRGSFLRSNQAGDRLNESNENPPRKVQYDLMVPQSLAAFDEA